MGRGAATSDGGWAGPGCEGVELGGPDGPLLGGCDRKLCSESYT